MARRSLLPAAVRILRHRPLTSFFVLAYLVSSILWIPVLTLGLPVFSPTTHTPSLWVLPGIAVGVTGSALLMTAVTEGADGIRRLLRRIGGWRVGLRWYAVAILLIPVSEVLMAAALDGRDALRALTPSALLLYPAAYLAHFCFGPLFEETGWRGFALPRLQGRFGPLRASLVLGLLWSGWHFFLYVPVWFSAGPVDGTIGVAMFTVSTVAMTFIFTWLANNTRASVLLAMLLHGSVDGTATYLQLLGDRGVITAETAEFAVQFGLLIACALWALVLTVVTRGRLGLSAGTQPAN